MRRHRHELNGAGRAGLWAALLLLCLTAIVAPPAAAQAPEEAKGLDAVIEGGIQVNNEDINDVLTILANYTGINMVTDKAVVGRVSFQFANDVTVRTVLDQVLPSYGWCYTLDEETNTVRINIEGQCEIAPPPTLIAKTFTLENISPDRVVPIIQTMLSPVGKATVIPGTRDIRVEDIPEVIARIENEIDILDRDRITHVFELNYLTVEEAQQAIEGIISAERGDIQAKPEYGILIVTDIAENIRRAIAIIEVLDVDPLQTLVIPINFADPDELQTAIEPLLSPEAYIWFDLRSSRLILRDIRTKAQLAAEVIEALDIPPLQCYVEGELLSIGDGDSFNVGVEWEFGEQVAAETSDSTATEDLFGDLVPNELAGLLTGGNLALNYLDPQDFRFAINAVRSHNNTKTLLSPRLLVVNDEQAVLHEGRNEPFEVRTRSRTIDGDDFISQRTERVGTELDIQPHITENGYVDILVNIEDSDTLPPREGADPNLLRTRETRAETVVTVKSGRTVVIGGLLRKRETKSNTGVPVLSQIPLIGMLFRDKSENEDRSKLMLFLTPHIVSVDDPYKIAWLDERNWKDRLAGPELPPGLEGMPGGELGEMPDSPIDWTTGGEISADQLEFIIREMHSGPEGDEAISFEEEDVLEPFDAMEPAPKMEEAPLDVQ